MMESLCEVPLAAQGKSNWPHISMVQQPKLVHAFVLALRHGTCRAAQGATQAAGGNSQSGQYRLIVSAGV